MKLPQPQEPAVFYPRLGKPPAPPKKKEPPILFECMRCHDTFPSCDMERLYGGYDLCLWCAGPMKRFIECAIAAAYPKETSDARTP